MDSGIKILMLDLPTKMTRWLFDFLLARITQVNVNGFLRDKISPIAGVPHGSVVSPLLSQVKFLGITFDSKFTFQKHFEEILRRCNTRYHRNRLLTNKNREPARPPYYKFTNNVFGQFSNMALFRP